MHRRFSIPALALGLVALASTSTREQPLSSVAHCRHEGLEQPADRVRREAALVVARAINRAQGALAEQSRRYHALSALGTLPEVPDGFELRFYSDEAGYMFALKDTRDSCHSAIFSDQFGLLYEKSALTAPQVAQ